MPDKIIHYKFAEKKRVFFTVQIRKGFLLRLKLLRTAGSETHPIVLSSLIQLKGNDECLKVTVGREK